MSVSLRLLLCIGILATCFNYVVSTVYLSSLAQTAFNQLKQGIKTYVIFQMTGDYQILELDTSSDSGFDALSANLAKTKEAAEPRYAVFSTTVSGERKLIFFVWIPPSVTPQVSKMYEAKSDDVKKALGADVWVEVRTGSIYDLNEQNIVESGKAGFVLIESSEYYYDLLNSVGTKDQISFDSSISIAYDNVAKGYNPYAILDISIDLSTITVEKVGARGATFVNLMTDLTNSYDAKYAIFSTTVNIGGVNQKKLILIVWIPPNVADNERVKMKSIVPQLKTHLKADIWFDFSASVPTDLNLQNIINLGLGGQIAGPSGQLVLSISLGANGALKDLERGSIRYALFKFSDDRSSIVVDKIAPLSANFNNFIDDLIQVQNMGEARYAVYLAPIRVKGQVQNKLILFLWSPFNAPTKTRALFETNFQNFKVMSKITFLFDVTANLVGELNLDAILKVALGADYEGQGNLGGSILGEGNANIPDVSIDATGMNAISQIRSGLKRYLIFSLSYGQAIVDKAAPISASFNDLKADLVKAQQMRQAKYAIFLAPVAVHGKTENKLILITWVPLDVPNTSRLLYIQSAPKFKLALNLHIWSEFTGITLADLDLSGFIKTGLKTNVFKVSFGPMDFAAGILNPFGVLGSIAGTATNMVGGLAGAALGIGGGLLSGIVQGAGSLIGGVIQTGANIIDSFFGGLFGGGSKGGFLFG